MHSRQTFLHRRLLDMRPTGRRGRICWRGSGRPRESVRPAAERSSGCIKGEARRRSDLVKQQTPCRLEKPLGRAAGARTKTDTGGQVEHTEAIGRTMVKELGTTTP